jgi:hypothetical protein
MCQIFRTQPRTILAEDDDDEEEDDGESEAKKMKLS